MQIQTCRRCFLPWYKTQQKGLNIAKELGSAIPECTQQYWCSDNNMFDGEILGHLHYQYRNYISENRIIVGSKYWYHL